MAAETLGEYYQRTKDEEATWPYKMDPTLGYIENRLACGIKLANNRIFDSSARDVRFKGMGTTLVTLLVNDDGADATNGAIGTMYVGHVGDSRCYRVRGGAIQQVTRDHSLLEDYKEARPDMTEEEERNFPHKNVITRALGMREAVQVDVKQEAVKDGDMFLMCSDGLSGMVTDPEILRTWASRPKPIRRSSASSRKRTATAAWTT